MLLEGMHLPLTTPFFADGRLNLRKLEQNIARYSLTPAAGMVVLGVSGEANLLTDSECDAVLRSAIGAAASTKVMMAGVGCDGVSATLERIGSAASLGYDAAVVRVPDFAGVAALEQGVYLRSVADRSALPLVLHGPVDEESLVEMAFHPRVLGYMHDFADAEELERLLRRTAEVKRSVTVTPVFAAVTGRMLASQMSGLVPAASLGGGSAVMTAPAASATKTRTRQVGFQVLAAGTRGMLAALLAGAVGAMPLLAAAAPQACYEVVAAWKDGDTPLAEEKQGRLVEAARVVEGLGVAGLKYGCDLNGYFGGAARLPLLPLLGEQRREIERVMDGLRS